MFRRYEAVPPVATEILLTTPLVEMLLPIRVAAHPLGPGFADLRGEKRAEPHPPKADGLVADVNAALMQEVFHISQ